MSKVEVKARAHAQITIELPLGDRWGDDCPVGQIHKQASDTARTIINKMFADHGGFTVSKVAIKTISTEQL